MIISRIQTTVSYICNFYAWKWWYRQERVNEWSVYIFIKMLPYCVQIIIPITWYWLFVCTRDLCDGYFVLHIYIYLFHVFVNKLLSLFQLSFYNSKQPFCWWNYCVNIFITTALRTLCLSAYLCLFAWGRVA